MPPSRCRPFTVLDAMILVAATAVGMVVILAVDWAIMAWGQTGRREPGWVDLLGMTLGYLWLASFGLALVQPQGPS